MPDMEATMMRNVRICLVLCVPFFLASCESAVKEAAVNQTVATPSDAAKPAPAVGRFEKTYRPSETIKDCGVCPEMVVVPAGRFLMGSPVWEPERDVNEGPRHDVTVPSDFAVGKFEVTFSEWDAYVTAGGCRNRAPDRGWGRGLDRWST